MRRLVGTQFLPFSPAGATPPTPFAPGTSVKCERVMPPVPYEPGIFELEVIQTRGATAVGGWSLTTSQAAPTTMAGVLVAGDSVVGSTQPLASVRVYPGTPLFFHVNSAGDPVLWVVLRLWFYPGGG